MRRHLLWSALTFIGALQAHYLAERWYAGTLVVVVGAAIAEWSRAELQYGEEPQGGDTRHDRQRGQ